MMCWMSFNSFVDSTRALLRKPVGEIKFQFFCRFYEELGLAWFPFSPFRFNSFVDSTEKSQKIFHHHGISFNSFVDSTRPCCVMYVGSKSFNSFVDSTLITCQRIMIIILCFNSFVDSTENLYTCFIFKYCASVFSQGILLPRPWENSARRGKA